MTQLNGGTQVTLRHTVARSAASLALSIFLTTGGPAVAAQVSADEAHAIGVDAYLYFYPLVTMDLTRRQLTNVEPGTIVANDGFADAGIWAPYKAGVEILTLRSPPADGTAEQRALVAENILRLDEVPEAMAAACRLGLGYVYRGAVASEWDSRRLPSAAELRQLPYLEAVFSQGDASVLRVRPVVGLPVRPAPGDQRRCQQHGPDDKTPRREHDADEQDGDGESRK